MAFKRLAITIILAAFIVTSCAPLPKPGTALTPEERAAAKKSCIARYTAGGAIGGAVIGYLLGSKNAKWEGAAIGAAAGGALAFALAYGHCLALFSDLSSYPVAGYQETVQNTGYQPSQGSITKIENFSLDPTVIAPGDTVKVNGTYYIMAPEGTKEVKVTETRIVHYYDSSKQQWKQLGAVDQEVISALGTRSAEGSFDLPADVPEGDYRITFKVCALGQEDTASQELSVKKDVAMDRLKYPYLLIARQNIWNSK